jgi:hypothetical protein
MCHYTLFTKSRKTEREREREQGGLRTSQRVEREQL